MQARSEQIHGLIRIGCGPDFGIPDAPVSAVEILKLEHVLLRLGVLQPLLRILVEHSLVGLQRQNATPALADDQLQPLLSG